MEKKNTNIIHQELNLETKIPQSNSTCNSNTSLSSFNPIYSNLISSISKDFFFLKKNSNNSKLRHFLRICQKLIFEISETFLRNSLKNVNYLKKIVNF